MNEYWDELWTRGYDANMGSGAAKAFWGDPERAQYYDSEVCKNDWEKGRRQIAGIPHKSSDTVLDIGAGPGALAIPFSREVRHVTAVEPSAAMNRCARRHMRNLRIGTIDIVEKAWEDVDIAADLDSPYDLVVCSFSLGMRTIRAALQKMHDACRGTVHLYWHLGDRAPERELSCALAKRGLPFEPIPKANIVYNILYDMGIYPSIEVTRRAVLQTYPTLQAACETYGGKHALTKPEERETLKDVMADLLTVDRSGQYCLDTVWYSAHMWWRADT